jgi:hypothetical protein
LEGQPGLAPRLASSQLVSQREKKRCGVLLARQKDTAMSFDTDRLPQAVTSSSDAAANASHSLQIVSEKLAEHTIEFGEAMAQFVAPAAPNEAAEAFSHRLEKVAHSLGQIYQDANSSAQSMYQVADEGFRRHSELGMHFIEELVLKRN